MYRGTSFPGTPQEGYPTLDSDSYAQTVLEKDPLDLSHFQYQNGSLANATHAAVNGIFPGPGLTGGIGITPTFVIEVYYGSPN